jgi:hypothetical protein
MDRDPTPFHAELWDPAQNAWVIYERKGSHHAASREAREASKGGRMARVRNTEMGVVTVTYRDGLAV